MVNLLFFFGKEYNILQFVGRVDDAKGQSAFFFGENIYVHLDLAMLKKKRFHDLVF